jgi:hypothetical protein
LTSVSRLSGREEANELDTLFYFGWTGFALGAVESVPLIGVFVAFHLE